MKEAVKSIATVEQLEDMLSTPSESLRQTLSALTGDLLILGVGGKMGPTLSKMAKRALEATDKKVIGVDLFKESEKEAELEDFGIETIKGDLLDRAFVNSLPDVKNVIYMAGMKFGSTENVSLTWAINTFLPTLVMEKFTSSRITAFSTGNVYPMVSLTSGGCMEDDPVGPVGDYAQSCLGRERMFQHFSIKNQTPVTIVRLNYAVEMRYGVLVDIAYKVKNDMPVDVTMGFFNVIWQRDANDMILHSLALAESPARIFNVAGPEIVSQRWIANRFGELFGVEPRISGEEADTAYLNNAATTFRTLGYPNTSLEEMILWIADWLKRDQPISNKPTHFQERGGKY